MRPAWAWSLCLLFLIQGSLGVPHPTFGSSKESSSGEVGDQEFWMGVAVPGVYEEDWQRAQNRGWFKQVDIVGLAVVAENQSALRFWTAFQDPQHEPGVGEPRLQWDYWIRLSVHGSEYAILPVNHGEEGADLSHVDDGEVRGDWRDVSVEPSSNGTGLEFIVKKSDLAGPEGQPFVKGTTIRNIRAQSLGQAIVDARYTVLYGCTGTNSQPARACVAEARDRFPDEGAIDAYVGTLNPAAAGHLQFIDPRPTRVSNGEATTYLFEIIVNNFGTVDDHLAISALGVPDSWTMSVPSSVLVPASDSALIPATVSVPFQHQHGLAKSVQVTVTSGQDPSVTHSSTFTVAWVSPPQPAGHHNVLHIHVNETKVNAGGLFPSVRYDSWLNTHRTDPAARGEDRLPIIGDGFEGRLLDLAGNYQEIERTVIIPMRPGLRMGLDGLLGEAGTAEVTLEAISDMEVTLEGALQSRRPLDNAPGDQVRPLFQFGPVREFLPGQSHIALETNITALPIADYLPYAAGSNLEWLLNVTVRMTAEQYLAYEAARQGQNPGVILVPSGTRLQMPLADFHDRIESTTLDERLVFSFDESSHPLANAGGTRLFTFTLSARSEIGVAIDLRGSIADWGRVEPREATLGPGETRKVFIAVTVPSEATAGDVRHGVVEVLDKGSGNILAAKVLRLEVTADPVPDDAEHAAALFGSREKRSPAPWFPIIVIEILVAGRFFHRKRRHDQAVSMFQR